MTDISNTVNKLKELVDKSNKILITSHVSPDPDSISSILLLGTALKTNFSEKEISLVSEELPDNLTFLPGFDQIKSQPLIEAINGQDLIIIVDAMNFGRCSRDDYHQISRSVKKMDIPVAIIDHHEAVGVEDNAAYVNEGYPAAVEQVFNTCFNQLKLKKPEGYAQITMTGLYSDTGGFTYLNGKYNETLKLVGQLIDDGVKIEEVKHKLYQYTKEQMQVVSELADNITKADGYTFTFLTDEFTNKWADSGKNLQQMHSATKIFTDNFIRNIEGRSWGFLVYKDTRIGENMYSVSFRSVGGTPDVSAIASKLSGGGHKAASGARVDASSVHEAVEKIKKIISETV
jgi:phosphoesterase RecJ-like protein